MSNTERTGRMPSADETSRDWDSVVKRISDRMRAGPEGRGSGSSGAPNPARAAAAAAAAAAAPGPAGRGKAGELTAELTRLERRALEAEAALVSERDAYVVRVKEMETKLRKIEPWIRKLKGEYQKACQERDELRARLKRKTGRTSSDAEAKALQQELDAARAAKESARTELANVRRQLETDRQSLQEAWQKRIVAAEKARDQAVEDLRTARKTLGENRRTEEEVRRLQKQLEQNETSTAAHKAVARAAQEETDGLKARIVELEKECQQTRQKLRHRSGLVKQRGSEVRDLEKQASEAAKGVAEAQARASAFEAERDAVAQQLQAREEAVEQALAQAAEHETALTELQAHAERTEQELAELRRANEDAEQMHQELEQLRSASADAQQRLEATQAELGQAREGANALEQELAEARASANAVMNDLEAMRGELARAEEESRGTSDRIRTLEAELKDAQTAGNEALSAASATRKRLDEQDAELETARKVHTEFERQMAELGGRVEHAELERDAARTDLEHAQGTLAALEDENRTLSSALQAERANASTNLESAEQGWKGELAAIESRYEAELAGQRDRAQAAEESATALEERLKSLSESREQLMGRVRERTPALVRQHVEQLTAGLERLLLSGDDTVMLELGDPGNTHIPGGESLPRISMDGTPDWERVLNDVEALANEVRGLNSDEYDTAELDRLTSPADESPGGTESASGPAPVDALAADERAPEEPPHTADISIDESELMQALEAAQSADDGAKVCETSTVEPSDVARAVAEAAAAESAGDGSDPQATADEPAPLPEDDEVAEISDTSEFDDLVSHIEAQVATLPPNPELSKPKPSRRRRRGKRD